MAWQEVPGKCESRKERGGDVKAETVFGKRRENYGMANLFPNPVDEEQRRKPAPEGFK